MCTWGQLAAARRAWLATQALLEAQAQEELGPWLRAAQLAHSIHPSGDAQHQRVSELPPNRPQNAYRSRA